MASNDDSAKLPDNWAEEMPTRRRKALSHPIRRQILRVLLRDVQTLSPVEVARSKIVPCSITEAAYHVEVLACVELVEQVETEALEGTFERFFSAAPIYEDLVTQLLDATEVGDLALLASSDT
jgi:hypothetical protein